MLSYFPPLETCGWWVTVIRHSPLASCYPGSGRGGWRWAHHEIISNLYGRYISHLNLYFSICNLQRKGLMKPFFYRGRIFSLAMSSSANCYLVWSCWAMMLLGGWGRGWTVTCATAAYFALSASQNRGWLMFLELHYRLPCSLFLSSE